MDFISNIRKNEDELFSIQCAATKPIYNNCLTVYVADDNDNIKLESQDSEQRSAYIGKE